MASNLRIFEISACKFSDIRYEVERFQSEIIKRWEIQMTFIYYEIRGTSNPKLKI